MSPSIPTPAKSRRCGGVSFWLDAGETLSIVGRVPAAGKSVTIQTIMKLLPSPPSRIKSGSITYQGADITHLSDKAMESYRGKEFSMIFQDSMTSLNPTMRVGRQMCEGILRHQKVSRQEASASRWSCWARWACRTRSWRRSATPTPCRAASASGS